MPGIDIYARLGSGDWTTTDAAALKHAVQRARFDLMGVASARALAGDMVAGNAEVKALLDADKCFRGWIVINPASPELSAEELRRFANGSTWLGALLNWRISGEKMDSSACQDLVNAYRRYAKPLLVDVPDDEAAGCLESLAGQFSQMKFIARGAGGESWHSGLLAAKRQVNVFLEPFTSGSHTGKLEGLLEVLGPHRVLFASGFPAQNPGAALGLLLDSRLSDNEKQAILTTSAIRLFGLNR